MPDADPASWVFFDGAFARYADVRFGLMTHALHYGTGCFEGIRGYWDGSSMRLLQPAAHYDRLHDSARIIELELPYATGQLVDATLELARRNGYRTDCYVRPILFKSQEVFGVPYRDVRASFAIFTTPMGRYLDTERGIRCMVSSWRRVPDSAIPVRAKVTGAYVNSHLAKSEALRFGYDEAIVLDQGGHVSEGSAENLFLRRGGAWATPPVTSDILEGITRRMVLELLGSVTEREIDRTELYACEELFLCGTGAEIAPVLEVDGRPVGTGSVGPDTKRLRELFGAIVRGREPRYASWLVTVG